MSELYWLPPVPANWRNEVGLAANNDDWIGLLRLAGYRLDFMKTNGLDGILKSAKSPAPSDFGQLRLAVLGSSTLAHLHAGIRVAGLRRGLLVETYENDYGQFFQELLNPESALHNFRPNAVLLAMDARYATQGIDALLSAENAEQTIAAFVEQMRQCWRIARDRLGAQIIQQTVLDVFPTMLGENEHRMAGSRSFAVQRINAALRAAATEENVSLLSIDTHAAHLGLRTLHDVGLWHRTKQEIISRAVPLYGEWVARLLAAGRGLAKKCLVLDLDNTLWGGVIGDDGLGGIALGQGSGEGESFLAIQDYARELGRRGIILAVCSKNDEANAWLPFDEHSETVLKRADIACFVANWSDKATNIRSIAQRLNIGLDSLVFLDDNPFERDLVRTELPMVAVPEFPDDPALVPQTLADAGYFDGIAVTSEDNERTELYRSNLEREAFGAVHTDLDSYLGGLDMRLIWEPFSAENAKRAHQLINKTNQFNLTTERYTEAQVEDVVRNSEAFGLTFRLTDRFGDNGIIGIVICRRDRDGIFLIDTWLMSCRVLGRQVERAMLNVVVEQAREFGARSLVGIYRPTSKNGMVRNHYSDLGFTISTVTETETVSSLDLQSFTPEPTFHAIKASTQ